MSSKRYLPIGLERQGRWLFRWRGFVPLPLLVALLAWVSFDASPGQAPGAHRGWEVLCLGVGLVGLMGRAWVSGSVPVDTSGRNRDGQLAARLNTSGPYSLVRHPLYLGSLVMWVATAMFSRSLIWVGVAVVYFWVCYRRIMMAEERFLLSQFGTAFLEWSAVTPAVIPAFSNWRSTDLWYSWRMAVRREGAGMLSLVVSMGLLNLAEETGRMSRPTMDPFWIALVVGTTTFYIVLRTLRRQTTWFHVVGR